MREKVRIFIEKCRDTAVIPRYVHEDDAGMDIYAAEPVTVEPGQTALVPTGLKMAIPDGFELQVRPRSGLSLKTPLRVPNSPGTIDSGYRNEICVIVWNSSPDEAVTVNRGDRIAQFVLARVPMAEFVLTDNVAELGVDRGGGFGSSGVSDADPSVNGSGNNVGGGNGNNKSGASVASKKRNTAKAREEKK